MSAGNAGLVKSGIDTRYAAPAKEKYVKNLGRKVPRSTPKKAKYPSDRHSMLEGEFNLVCHAGHRAWSPTPEAWYGMKCYIGECQLLQHPLGKDGQPQPIPGRDHWRTLGGK